MTQKQFYTNLSSAERSRQDPGQENEVRNYSQNYNICSRKFYGNLKETPLSALANIMLIFVLTTVIYSMIGGVFFILVKIFSFGTVLVNWIIASVGSLYILTIISFIFIGHTMKNGLENRSIKEVFRKFNQQSDMVHTPYV